MKQVYEVVSQGLPARAFAVKPEDRKRFMELQLITSKPIMYVCNVSEEDALEGNKYTKMVQEKATAEEAVCVTISAKIEEEIAQLASEEEKKEFLETIGLEEAGLARTIRAGYKLLNLITFFTVGPKEARAWTLRKSASAPQAAGVIHTDFEKGFIRAETIAYQDYVSYKGEQGAKEAGKLRLEGKEYAVMDGDVMHFRFNV
jgi:GTP-binding protein YchF